MRIEEQDLLQSLFLHLPEMYVCQMQQHIFCSIVEGLFLMCRVQTHFLRSKNLKQRKQNYVLFIRYACEVNIVLV